MGKNLRAALSVRRGSIVVLSDVATAIGIVVGKHSGRDVNGVETSIL